jgi:carboxyl-terminal processing protease
MKKLQVWLPLLFALVMILGMVIGFRLRGGIRATGFFTARKQSPVQEVLDLVNMRYVDSVNMDSLGNDAIDGLLKHLDPHSIYIPPADLQTMNEELQGNFEGIGVIFQIYDDTVNVVEVLAGGPSEKAGLKIGDKFLTVGDSVVAGNGINNDRIRKLLRGPGASSVAITVSRPSVSDKPIRVVITRGTIPLPSVDASYFIDKGLGYIHINKFSVTTHAEFAKAVQELQTKGLQKLILDLRGNGGGILQQSIEVADDFLDGEKLITYTVGAHSPKTEYHCRRDGLFEKGKLVLLTDEGTASASEILAGALQDWDRATIVGRRTFGKGLVQEPYILSNGASLRLTIARYYTPTGRSIQKPYNKGLDEYNEEVIKRFHDGEVLHGDTTHTGPAFRTKGGRLVYGGGGITPDIFVSFDTASLAKSTAALYMAGTMDRFVYLYYIQHQQAFSAYRDPAAFIAGFHDDTRLWGDLSAFAAKDSIDLRPVPPKDKELLLERLKALLARQVWQTEGYFEVSNSYDPVIKKALAVAREN